MFRFRELEGGLQDGDHLVVSHEHQGAADRADHVGEVTLEEGLGPLVPGKERELNSSSNEN